MFKKKKPCQEEMLPDYGAGQKTRKILDEVVFWISVLLVGALLLCGVRYVAPRGLVATIVEGDSMLDTLHDGQLTFCYRGEYSRGDIVVATTVKNEEELLVIKRIIGMPGETVKIDAAGVYIDGQKLDEPYLSPANVQATYEDYLINSITLAEDEYFLMGDNRQVSYDSRWFGAVKVQELGPIQSETPVWQTWVFAIGVLAFGIALGYAITFLDDKIVVALCKAIAKKKTNKK